jgi:MoaA/NifB/PqqE/SkfB family radical SAM enzyme
MQLYSQNVINTVLGKVSMNVGSKKADFHLYEPPYGLFDTIERYYSVARTFVGASKIILKSKFTRQRVAIGASVEITDRCNAGCHHCYVYDPDWDQNKRMEGYLQLPVQEHRQAEKAVYQTLDRLRNEGKVLVTLVGGEPFLAPKIIHYASRNFPVVWVVSNGAAKFPSNLARSVVVSISIDGLPDYHNKLRDPIGFFSKHTYGGLAGMTAAIVRNINESERGAFVHTTLTKSSLETLPNIIDWLVQDVKKLRGIMISGAAMKSNKDPEALTPEDRLKIKEMLICASEKYSPRLFPFNSSVVNDLLFEPENIITQPSQCTVSNRVDSYGFDGKIVGKCVLRDESSCETCICNLTGLMKGVARRDAETIKGLYRTCLG